MSLSIPESALAKTLKTALSQCEEQVRAIERQKGAISSLEAEVSSLKQALETSKKQDIGCVGNRSSQTETLLRQNVEKQFEIDALRKKVKDLKEKLRRCRSEDRSSSDFLPTKPSQQNIEPALSSSAGKPCEDESKRNLEQTCLTPKSSPPRKRSRGSGSDNAFSGASAVASSKDDRILFSTETKDSKDQKEQLRRQKALEDFAEDGERLSAFSPSLKPDQSFTSRPDAFGRLETLLSGPSSTSPLLPKVSPVKSGNGAIPRPQRSFNPEIVTTMKGNPVAEPKVSSPRNCRIRPSKQAPMEPSSIESLRSRPLNQLNFANFRINPSFLDDSDTISHATRKGREIQAYAPGKAKMTSDNEILRHFLGEGSEERINSLTGTARQNLLHEAKTKISAESFGSMHSELSRRQSPSGFWNTDMPGSQDDKLQKENGKVRELEELRMRYQSAISGTGQWLFADE